MTATLSYRVDEGEDMVIPAESNGDDKEVTEEENEVGNAETSKKVIEDVVHGPESKDIETVDIPRHLLPHPTFCKEPPD